jgi:hypothetical protein
LLAGVEQIKETVNPVQWCKAFECGIEAIKRLDIKVIHSSCLNQSLV